MCISELSLEAKARIEEKRDSFRLLSLKSLIPARQLLGSSPPKPAAFELRLRPYVSALFGLEAPEYSAICSDSNCLHTALDDLALRIEAEVLSEFTSPLKRHVSVQLTSSIIRDELQGCVNRWQDVPSPDPTSLLKLEAASSAESATMRQGGAENDQVEAVRSERGTLSEATGDYNAPGDPAKQTPSRDAAAAKKARAVTVAKLVRELDNLKPQMFEDESEYEHLRAQYPDYLTFKVAEDRPDLKRKVLSIRGSTRHTRLAQELAGAHYGRELSTIQDDWKDFKPSAFKRPK